MWNELMTGTFWWLKALGLEIQTMTKSRKLWTGFLTFSLIYSIVLVLLAWENNFDVAVEILDQLLPGFEAVVKRFLILMKKPDFRKILALLQRLEERQDIVRHPLTENFYKISKRCLVILRIIYMSAVFVMLSKPILSNKKTMPYLIWLPSNWNDEESWTFAQLVYMIVQTGVAFVLILSIAVVDSLYVSVVVHLVAHITIINHDFEQMFGQSDKQHEKMVDIVERQNLCFECLELMNGVFSVQLLNQLLTIVVTNCMAMVIINDKGFFTINSYIQLLMLSSSVLQAFVYCFFGDFIKDKLEETIFAIYSCDWYNNPENANNLIILMQRANRIKTFTFGGLLNMDLNTFALIMKNSFSFYALLSAEE